MKIVRAIFHVDVLIYELNYIRSLLLQHEIELEYSVARGEKNDYDGDQSPKARLDAVLAIYSEARNPNLKHVQLYDVLWERQVA